MWISITNVIFVKIKMTQPHIYYMTSEFWEKKRIFWHSNQPFNSAESQEYNTVLWKQKPKKFNRLILLISLGRVHIHKSKLSFEVFMIGFRKYFESLQLINSKKPLARWLYQQTETEVMSFVFFILLWCLIVYVTALLSHML